MLPSVLLMFIFISSTLQLRFKPRQMPTPKLNDISLVVHKLFIYGTMKQGEPNHYFLEDPKNGLCKFLGLGRTVVKYPMVIGSGVNIPFLLNNPGSGHKILGEVYIVDRFMLRNLDVQHIYPISYARKMDVIKMYTEDSLEEEVMCWFYYIRIANVGLNTKGYTISEFSSKNIKQGGLLK